MRDKPTLRDAAAALPADATITVLEAHDRPPAGLARVGGPGFDLGVRQPAADDTAMTHIWTLPTADVPALRAAFPDAVAVALYILRPEDNEAYEVDSGQTALVALGADDVARGLAAPTGQDLRPRHVTAAQVEVASSAFAGYYLEDGDGNEVDEDDESPRRRLRQAIYALSARAGGGPIWLQGDEHDGEFLLQFDERFADINLGDVGVMYVFTDQQFWQCH